MKRNGELKKKFIIDCATVDIENPYKSDDYLVLRDNENRHLVLVADGSHSEKLSTPAHKVVMDVFNNSFIHLSDFESVQMYLRQTLYVAASLLMQNFFDTSKNSTTTISGFLVDKDGEIFTVNIGNSRVYLYSKNSLKLLTRDHSKAFDLFLNGYLAEQDVHQHPDSKNITSIVGKSLSNMRVDVEKIGKIKRGDVLIACTDGFYPVLYNKKYLKHLKRYLSSTKPAETLLTMALEYQTFIDNMTVCVLIAKH